MSAMMLKSVREEQQRQQRPERPPTAASRGS